jgi:prephenate dehydrogenase
VIDHAAALDDRSPFQATVIGLGLIGASCAAAIRAVRPSWTVVGHDLEGAACARARERGLVHAIAASRDEALRAADFIVLATPVGTIVEIIGLLPTLVGRPAVIVDVGSTKQMIVEAMSALPHRLQAAGGHPMTGAVTAGTSEPTSRLFDGRAFVLCPTPSTRPETLNALKQLVADFKARVVEMTAAEHDSAVALVSHLPQLMAFPLLQIFDRATPTARSLAAGGFHARVGDAGENIPMWFDILRSNRPAVTAMLGEYRLELDRLEQAIREGEESDLRALLERGAQAAARIQTERAKNAKVTKDTKLD